MISPELGVVVGALVTVAGLYYRHLLATIADLKAEVVYWREKALAGTGLAEIATEQAEKPRPRRTR